MTDVRLVVTREATQVGPSRVSPGQPKGLLYWSTIAAQPFVPPATDEVCSGPQSCHAPDGDHTLTETVTFSGRWPKPVKTNGTHLC